MTTNRSDTNAFATKLIASVVKVRQWIGWLKNESATDHNPKPFANAFQAWNFQTHASPCGAAPARTSAVRRGGGVETRGLSDGHVDGVAATWSHEEAIAATVTA